MTSLGDMLRAELEEKPEPKAASVSLWEHEPVSLTVFVQDVGYLGNPKLSDIQYDAVRHIERVYYPDAYPLLAELATDKDARQYWAEPVRMTNFAELEWGKGGGKDMVCRVASSRVAYLLLCLYEPLQYFGFPRHDSIHLLNVAESSHQASTAFFAPLRKSVIDSTGWFARNGYAHPLKNEIQYAKNILAISGHSDAETQEGLNILLGVADEIDGFKTLAELERYMGASARESSRAAEVLLSMMETSGSTRFPETFKNVRLSWPRYLGSMIQQLVAQGEDDNALRGEDSRHYVSGPHSTWDVNPLRRRSDFDRLFARDPALARARLECRPGRAVNPYFTNTAVIDASMHEAPESPVTVSYVRAGGSWNPHYEFSPSFVPVNGAAYAMHADLAINGCRAGICISHVSKWDEVQVAGHDDEGGDVPVWEMRPFVRVDALFGFEADASADPPLEIQIRWARLLFLELRRRGWNMRRFTADGFQSVDTFQILETQYGIETDLVSTDKDPGLWRNLKDLFNEARIWVPNSELCKTELYGLSRLPNGKIDHPNGGCFTGDTRIPLLDGTCPPLSELDGQRAWVYSARPDGSIVPGYARCRRTKITRHLVDVILDSGFVARCTPDHLWMLRDGTYKPARDLVPGADRLMPIARTWPVNGGYERVTDASGRRTLTHVLVAEWKLGRKLDKSEIAHHDNEVKTDNCPDNIHAMDWQAHRRHHARLLWDEKKHRVWAGHAVWAETAEAKDALAGRDFSRNRFAGLSAEQRSQLVQDMAGARARKDVTIDSLRALAGVARNANEAARMLSCGRNVVQSRLRVAGYATWAEFSQMADNNHKVRWVLPVELAEPVPVYDLEVDEWNNFALLGGVFVHNSKDLADALAGSAAGALELGGADEVDALGRPVEAHLASANWPQAMPAGELPIGFQAPWDMRYDEVLRHHVVLDGLGRPEGPSFWNDVGEAVGHD